MACTECNSGLFLTTDFNWNLVGSVPVTLPNGTTISRISASSLSVSKGGISKVFNAASGGQMHYYNWGSPANYLAILSVSGGATGDRIVVIVDTESSGLNTNTIVYISASSTVPLPIINHCAGSGGSIISMASNGSSTIAAMWTSDRGMPLCSAGSFVPTQQVSGNATATDLQILHGSTVIASCARPSPDCQVTPLTSGKVVFSEAITGAGVDPSLSSTTKQVTISNNGSNCLRVNSIGNSTHFSLIAGSESKPFPVTLQVGESFHFDVRFTPPTVAVETNYDESMAISPTPAKTDIAINCRGKARPPQRTITYNNISFGSVALGTTPSPIQNLQIHNTGEVPITVAIPSPPSGIAYGWIPPSGALATIAEGSILSMAISYTPIVEGSDNRTLAFTSDANGSPHSVLITGSGCVPRPKIQIPNMGPLITGNVQQGFRTVRAFKVCNTGNGNLQFSARIIAAIPGDIASESDASQFGLLQDNATPVTSPLNSFSNQIIAPVTICGGGSTGSGEFTFGVTFFASGSTRSVNAQLEIFNHNDTSSGTPISFIISLTAIVTNAVSVDLELVLDRSGSMAESSGSRTKIETTRDAAKLFVALSRVDVNDRIGLVRYDSNPELVLVNGNSIQEITTSNHAVIGDAINPANFFPGSRTCIAGGVMVAEKDINNHPRVSPPAELNKIIIVLTDGIDNEPYINTDDGVTYTLLGGTINGSPFPFSPTPSESTALPVPSDIKIYAIGIGDNIAVGRLSTLATSTGGLFLHAREFSGIDYFNLEKHFTQVYMEAVNYALISDPVFTINRGESHSFEFEVLNGDKSAMVVIYDKDGLRIPFFIQSPLNEAIDLLSVPVGFQIRPGISPTARFIEINMPQGEPERYAGTWKVVLKHDGRACFSQGENKGANQRIGVTQTHVGFGSGFQPLACKDNYNQPIMYGISIGVGSNFNMIPFITPGIVRIGESIQLTAMVSEFGLPVKGCTISVMAIRPDGTQTTHILKDDGLHGDDQPNDGTYGLAFIHTYCSGTYSFTFTCTGYSRVGKPIKREAVRSKYVEGREPLIPSATDGGGNITNGQGKKCCRFIFVLLSILVVVGVIVIFLLTLILKR